MNISTRPSSALVFSALITVQVLFALNYIFSKFIVAVVPPLAWASFRIIIAAVMMILVAIGLKRPLPKDLKGFYIPLIGFSLLGTVINQSCFLMGLKYTTATNSAVLTTLIPIFTLIFVTILGQEKATKTRIFGFICALSGVLVLRKIEEFKLSDETVWGDFLTIINCVSYGLFLATSKKFIETHDRFWTTAMLFAYGSVGVGLVAIPSVQSFVWPQMTPLLAFSMVFAVLFGTIITYFLNNWALAYAKSTQVAIFIYIQPVITASVAYFWLGEEITRRTVFSSLLIFAGVLLAIRKTESNVRISKSWK
jgi:drug/metabolite transporter (DMT)-like permease